MKKSCDNEACENCKIKVCKHGGGGAHGGDVVYVLGIIGAAIFFISPVTDFWAGVVGFLKAMVWPVFMVYEAFHFLIK